MKLADVKIGGKYRVNYSLRTTWPTDIKPAQPFEDGKIIEVDGVARKVPVRLGLIGKNEYLLEAIVVAKEDARAADNFYYIPADWIEEVEPSKEAESIMFKIDTKKFMTDLKKLHKLNRENFKGALEKFPANEYDLVLLTDGCKTWHRQDAGDKDTGCVCAINVLMTSGCKCGYLNKERGSEAT